MTATLLFVLTVHLGLILMTRGQACSGGQVYNFCGSPCNKTCGAPYKGCGAYCVSRCECPGQLPYWNATTRSCLSEEECHDLHPPGPQCRGKCRYDYCHEDGVCAEGCQTSYHGDLCTGRCPTECQYDECDQTDSACMLGCEEGKHGVFCELDCPRGCYAACHGGVNAESAGGQCAPGLVLCSSCTGLCQGQECKYPTVSAAPACVGALTGAVTLLMMIL